MQAALSHIGASSLSETLRLLHDWWLGEFENLLPARFARWLSGPGRAVLIVAIKGDDVTLELLDGASASIVLERIEPMAVTEEFIEQFLKLHGADPSGTDIGIQLAEHCIFTREIQLPSEAARAIEAIAAQDLVKKTPFKPEDIYSDFVATAQDGKKRILVQQWIVRRRYVEDALSLLNVGIERLTFVTCPARDTDQLKPVIKLKKETLRGFWLKKLTLTLSCSALFLAIVGGGLKYWSQQQEMDRLAIEITMANKNAQQVRALVDQLQEKKGALSRLRRQRSELPGVIDLWEEITRILPNHTWLTELRLSETPGQRDVKISISGFSNAATGLVGVIDGSPMLSDAALTSPVAFDATEGKERFSLQAKLKLPEMSR